CSTCPGPMGLLRHQERCSGTAQLSSKRAESDRTENLTEEVSQACSRDTRLALVAETDFADGLMVLTEGLVGHVPGLLDGPLPDSEVDYLPLTPALDEFVVFLQGEAGCLRHPVAGRIVHRDLQDRGDRTALPSEVERNFDRSSRE